MSIYAPDDLINGLKNLGNVDKVAPRMLEAGVKPVEKAVKKNARKHIRTGQMADSVASTKPKKDKNDNWGCAVTFKGKDKKTGVRNAQKAFVNEYGKQGQEPQPIVRPAVIESEKESLKEMQDIFEFETQLSNIKV